jgi:hypothetical protein
VLALAVFPVHDLPMNNRQRALVLLGVVGVVGCFGGSSDSRGTTAGTVYSFATTMSARISRYIPSGSFFSGKADDTVQAQSTQPALCSSVVCFDATKLTGTYYKIGLLIQASGSGLLASFGDPDEPWSDVAGGLAPFDFNSETPVTESGTLSCCGGTGNLATENTYFSDVVYLFGYLDATFTISGITNGNTSMNAEHTVRFVMADGAHPNALRGDILYKDAGTFKWMPSSGTETLTATRPASPVTMNSAIVNWTNPFGTQGQQNIPTLSVPIASCDPAQPNAPHVVTEAELKDPGRTYSFGFNTTKLVMFPTLLSSGTDINLISSIRELMTRVHLAGLPHSAQPMGVGSPASTQLTVSVSGSLPWSCPPSGTY